MGEYAHLFQPIPETAEPKEEVAPSAIDQAPKGPAVAPAYTQGSALAYHHGATPEAKPENTDLASGDVFEDLEAIIAKPEIPEQDRTRLREILGEGKASNATRDDILEKLIVENDKRLNPLQRAAEKTIVGRALGRAGVKVGDTLTNIPLRVMGFFGNEEADEAADAKNRAYAQMALFDKVRTDHSATAKVFGKQIANGVDVVTESIGQAALAGGAGRFVAGAAKATTPLAATYGNAALFGLGGADRALTDATDAGLEGAAKYGYAAGMGGLEAAIMIGMGAFGAAKGFTSLEEATLGQLAKRSRDILVRSGTDKAMKSALTAGAGAASEGVEEAVTQLSQNVWGGLFGMQDNMMEGVLEAGIIGLAAGGAANLPSALGPNLNKALTKAEVLATADVEAAHFQKDNPRVDIGEVINASNRKEFEALTGKKKTSEQYRKAFQDSLREQTTSDPVADEAVRSSAEADAQTAAATERDVQRRTAQGDPTPELDPQNAQEAAQKAAVNAQAGGFQASEAMGYQVDETGKFTASVQREGQAPMTAAGQVGPTGLQVSSVPQDLTTDERIDLARQLSAEADTQGVPVTSGSTTSKGETEFFRDAMANGSDVQVNPTAQFDQASGQYRTADGQPVFSMQSDGGQRRAQISQEGKAIAADVETNPREYEGGVGTLHASINELRPALTLGTMTSPESVKWSESLSQAQAEMQAGRLWPRDIADAVMMGRRTASSLDRTEKAAVAIRLAQLKNEFERLNSEVGSLKEKGDLALVGAAEAKMQRVIAEADILTDVGFKAGSEVGALLNQQKLLLDNDLNLIPYRGRMRAAKKSQLTAVDEEFAQQVASDWQRVTQSLDASTKKLNNEVGERFVHHAKTSKAVGEKRSLMEKIRELLNKGCDLL